MITIYVGNLPLSATTDDVVALFQPHGQVRSATVMLNEETGQSRGFGFVEMDEQAAWEAIEALDGMLLQGHRLRINESRDRGKKPKRRAF
ncbi:RNA-binding protein [bacterium DOLJORAL78_65_58]|nr:MAG: RNA-binding protein [bacterium DOLZORAL124_64_63]PIE76134.1 MAG: RNA-binding protein [bacterium DOLJORAL78_65_58]